MYKFVKKSFQVVEALVVIALFLLLLPGRVNAAPDINTMWLSNGTAIIGGKTASNQTPNNPTINNAAGTTRQKDIYFLYCPAGTVKAFAAGADLTADSQPGKPNLLFTLSKDGKNANAFDNDATTGSASSNVEAGSGVYTFTVELVTPSATSTFQTYLFSLYCANASGQALPLTFSNTNGTYAGQIRDN
jgi:hypothetical protein